MTPCVSGAQPPCNELGTLQGLPPPKELNLQSCLLDRASMLMLQVVLPYALLLGSNLVHLGSLVSSGLLASLSYRADICQDDPR